MNVEDHQILVRSHHLKKSEWWIIIRGGFQSMWNWTWPFNEKAPGDDDDGHDRSSNICGK
jgi:hypothetical protein